MFQFTISSFAHKVLNGRGGEQEDAKDCIENQYTLTEREFLVLNLGLFLAVVK